MLYNIPGQSVTQWLNNLKTVVEMKPDHIAIYSLTAEKGTPFYTDIQNGDLSLPDAAIEGKMYKQGSQYLRDCRFTQYEVSHFAKPGKECRHNLHYWKRDPNLAFGPSAHGFDGEKRYWNVASLEKYGEILSQNNLPIQNTEILSAENIVNEIVMNGLRTNLGVPTSCFDNIDDISIQKWESYLEIENGSLLLKPEYFHLADEITADLMVG
jgi:oxygen-independent coproporphyrinogen-3 oxidase